MKVKFTQTGDFKNTEKYFVKTSKFSIVRVLNKFGDQGVTALREATPIDSGKTAESWSYEITKDRNGATISFNNSHINNGVNIAIILQYGHATNSGAYVQGIDYINPALAPVFDSIAKAAWKEVTRV